MFEHVDKILFIYVAIQVVKWKLLVQEQLFSLRVKYRVQLFEYVDGLKFLLQCGHSHERYNYFKSVFCLDS